MRNYRVQEPRSTFSLVAMSSLLKSSSQMTAGLFRFAIRANLRGCLTVFRALAVVTTICACSASLLLLTEVSQRALPRNALWEVVRNVCVPGQLLNHDPVPAFKCSLSP